MASAVGGFITAQILSFIGYVPNAVQSEYVLNGILIGAVLIPVVLMVFQLIMHMFYKLKDDLGNN